MNDPYTLVMTVERGLVERREVEVYCGGGTSNAGFLPEVGVNAAPVVGAGVVVVDGGDYYLDYT